jgi:hypothetical protein
MVFFVIPIRTSVPNESTDECKSAVAGAMSSPDSECAYGTAHCGKPLAFRGEASHRFLFFLFA